VWLDPDELVALARHWKGHPKLNRLGESVAEAMVEREQFRETLANLPSLPWLLAFSPLPIGDNLSVSRLPVVNLLLMVICVAIPVSAWWIGVPMERVWHVFGLVPARIVAGEAWLTTVTSMFVHGGFVHLLGNLFALAVFGDNVECRLGPVRYLAFYIVCGVAGGVAHIAYYPAEIVPAIGASGAISGVLGAYVVFYPQATIRTIYGIKAPAFAYIGVWIASQLFAVLLIVKYGHGASIAYFAHLGGLAAGLLVAISMRACESWQVRRNGPATP
jgi:membrane associated rhomboid family serine protease